MYCNIHIYYFKAGTGSIEGIFTRPAAGRRINSRWRRTVLSCRNTLRPLQLFHFYADRFCSAEKFAPSTCILSSAPLKPASVIRRLLPFRTAQISGINLKCRAEEPFRSLHFSGLTRAVNEALSVTKSSRILQLCYKIAEVLDFHGGGVK